MQPPKGNAPMAPKAPMRDFVKLQSTLYTLTKKCTKTCKNFLEDRYNLKVDDTFYSKLKSNPGINENYKICLTKCTADYATLNKYVRRKFMEDLDNTQDANQKIYDDFYR